MSKEIERKFLLPTSAEAVPAREELKLISREYIYQTYLAFSEDQEIRVRKNIGAGGEKRFTHTFKAGHGLSREEIEYAISESVYEQLLQNTNFVPLEKVRSTIEYQGLLLEVDEYKQVELCVVEVEFHDESAARAFKVPYWFGRELAQEEEFRNKTLWMKLQKRQ